MLLCSSSCGCSQHTEFLSQTALCLFATSCHAHCHTRCRGTWIMLKAGEIPVTARRPAQGCLTPSILRACFQFMTLISSRLKFSLLSVCFCLSVSICLQFWCRWVCCFWDMVEVFCSIAKNSNCWEETRWCLRAGTKIWVRWYPLSQRCAFGATAKGQSYGSLALPVSCVFQAEAAASKQHPSSIQAGLYLQLREQLLGFLVALENSAFLLVVLVVLVEEHEEKVWVKCRKLGTKNKEKDKPQMDRR